MSAKAKTKTGDFEFSLMTETVSGPALLSTIKRHYSGTMCPWFGGILFCKSSSCTNPKVSYPFLSSFSKKPMRWKACTQTPSHSVISRGKGTKSQWDVGVECVSRMKLRTLIPNMGSIYATFIKVEWRTIFHLLAICLSISLTQLLSGQCWRSG